MNLRERLIAGCLVVLWVGCASGMKIETHHADDVDFSTYRTWDWVPDMATKSIDPRVDDPVVQTRIRQAIVNQLLDRGYVRATSDPDFRVNYHAAISQGLSESAVDAAYSQAEYTQYDQNWTFQYAHGWDVGSLVIDVIDAGSQELAWRGSAQAEINLDDTREKKDKRVQEAVKKMLRNFPPK